jgi:micrococcal nuclease
MLSKKQTNLFIGIAVLIVSIFAIFFPTDSSEVSDKFKPTPTPIEDVYEKEVLGESTRPTSVPTPTNIVENPNVTSTLENPNRVYRVVKVIDGDTLDVDINGVVERLRLIGIDTPETVDPRKEVQCYGREASNKAKELLLGKSVMLEADETQGERDKYRRLLRYVILPSGINFNLQLITEGYAYEYTYNEPYKYQKEFREAQAIARENGIGLWNTNTCSGVR